MKKLAIMFPFQSLCFLMTLSVLNTLLPLVATAELEPVYDAEGEPVQPGLSYQVLPYLAEKGGLELDSIRNVTCPLYVIRHPSNPGTPTFFDVAQQPGEGESPLDYIPTSTDLTVKGFRLVPCLFDSKVWELSKVSPPGTTPGLWFVSANGTAGTTFTLFKIEKPEGCDHSCHIYYFKFCTSNFYPPVCGPLGTYVDADGTEVLALGDGIEPLFVKFKNFWFPPHSPPPPPPINQGLSIV